MHLLSDFRPFPATLATANARRGAEGAVFATPWRRIAMGRGANLRSAEGAAVMGSSLRNLRRPQSCSLSLQCNNAAASLSQYFSFRRGERSFPFPYQTESLWFVKVHDAVVLLYCCLTYLCTCVSIQPLKISSSRNIYIISSIYYSVCLKLLKTV